MSIYLYSILTTEAAVSGAVLQYAQHRLPVLRAFLQRCVCIYRGRVNPSLNPIGVKSSTRHRP